MKMVTRGGGGAGSRGNVDVQLRRCPDPDVCGFGLHVSTAYVNLKRLESFFLFCLLAMHTVDNSTCWVSVFTGAGTFNTKYLHYHLLFSGSRPFVVTSSYYGFEHSEHVENETLERLSSYWHWRRNKKKYVTYGKCWHLHFKCCERSLERSSVERIKHWQDELFVAICWKRRPRVLLLNLKSEEKKEKI